jgi:formylglycine-generating enzyme required for sulfatase activity
MNNNRKKPDPSARQFIVALVIVLTGVTLGTMLTMKFEGPRPANKPTALGHMEPTHSASATGNMAWIPGGEFQMGSTNSALESPPHSVTLDGFWIDRSEVTNGQFEKFTRATGYVTTAEKQPNSALTIQSLGTNTVPGSFVAFVARADAATTNTVEWRFVPGANWRHPQGPGSTLQGLEKHPVTHVSWLDATAYAAWVGCRLPTEAEWEFAAHGGLARQPFVWGERLDTKEAPPANAALFAAKEASARLHTTPAGSYPANRYGLSDLAGNAAEWCADWFHSGYYRESPGKNPPGPEASQDPEEPGATKKVIRGGSYLSDDAATLRITARTRRSPYTSYSDVGFRCARSAK